MKNFNENKKIPTWAIVLIAVFAIITLVSVGSNFLSVGDTPAGGGSDTHSHKAAEPVILKNDEKTHYVLIRCEGCNEVIVDNTANHVFMDGVCTICMYECACPEETLTHTWTDWNETDKTYTQTTTCSLCKKVFEPETVSATRMAVSKRIPGSFNSYDNCWIEIYVVDGMTWGDVYKLYDDVFYIRNWTDGAGTHETLYPLIENGDWEVGSNYLYHSDATVRPVRLTDKVIVYDNVDDNCEKYVFM